MCRKDSIGECKDFIKIGLRHAELDSASQKIIRLC